VTANPGTWDSGTSLSYQWFRGEGLLAGATTLNYQITTEDLGARLKFSVTSSKPGFDSKVEFSDSSASVAAGTLGSSPTPSISGLASVGQTLTASLGNWTTGTATSIQWLRNGQEILGQNTSTYLIQQSDLGSTFSVRATGYLVGYTTITRTSLATQSVIAGTMVSTPLPRITGTTSVGNLLTAVPGTWDVGVTLSYKWLRNGAEISGQTESTYTIQPLDRGSSITLEVTAQKSSYNAVIVTSPATNIITNGSLLLSPTPSISGSAVVAGVLVANAGVWDSGVSLTYQWLRGGVAVSGATGSSYTLLPSDLGAVFTVSVSGAMSGFVSVTRTSAATSAVTAGSLTLAPVPTVSGVLAVGQVLTVATGVWDDGVVFSYQWLRGGSPIVGATSTNYTLLPADRGFAFSVAVTATKVGYVSTTLASPSTSSVEFGSQVLSPSPVITVSGSGAIVVGSTLSVAAGVWDSGVSLSYQWFRSGSPVAGQTGSSYVLTSDDFGADISVTVSGVRSGYSTVVRSASVVSPVDFGSLILTPTPVISGQVRVGALLTVVSGTWDSGVVLSYRWFRDGEEILGQTESTYRLSSSDFDKTISVSVSAFKAGYNSVTKTSADSLKVGSGVLVLTPLPVINGLAAVGSTLTVSAGTWDSGVSLTYQWLRNGFEVAGATETSYLLSLEDRNAAMSVRVTGTRDNYLTASRRSWASQIVDNGLLVNAPTPVISGQTIVGQMLTATSGVWPDGVSLSFQWFRHGFLIPDARSASYTLTAEDAEAQLMVQITGSKEGYAPLTVESELTGEIRDGQLSSAPTPFISGVAKMGFTLTASLGTWDQGVTFEYQWLRGGDSIDEAIDPTYTIVSEDVGEIISVQVSSNLAGYIPIVYVVSTPKAVTPGSLTISKPSLTGTARVGNLLTLQQVEATPSGAEVFVQWFRGTAAIVDATGWTYTLVAADRGQSISAKVTAALDGYLDTTVTSTKTALVGFGTLSTKGSIALSATTGKVGATLTANPADWDSGATMKYQWRRNGVVIAGATAKSYKLVAADRGRRITATVIVSKPGFMSVTKTSRSTSLIAP
jgi:hypothetical protein